MLVKRSRLTSSNDTRVRVEDLQQRHLFRLLVAEEVELLVRMVVWEESRPLVLAPDVVAFDKVLVPERGGVAEGEGVVLDGVIERSPDATSE